MTTDEQLRPRGTSERVREIVRAVLLELLPLTAYGAWAALLWLDHTFDFNLSPLWTVVLFAVIGVGFCASGVGWLSAGRRVAGIAVFIFRGIAVAFFAWTLMVYVTDGSCESGLRCKNGPELPVFYTTFAVVMLTPLLSAVALAAVTVRDGVRRH